jgi:hypothetical protein
MKIVTQGQLNNIEQSWQHTSPSTRSMATWSNATTPTPHCLLMFEIAACLREQCTSKWDSNTHSVDRLKKPTYSNFQRLRSHTQKYQLIHSRSRSVCDCTFRVSASYSTTPANSETSMSNTNHSNLNRTCWHLNPWEIDLLRHTTTYVDP